MKKQRLNIICLMAAAFMFAACSSQTGDTAFKNASPELKQDWDQAMKADQANDFLAANTNYVSLLNRQISPEQLLAVQSAVGALNARMQAAAAKGNAAAQKAIEDLKNLGAQRPGRPGPR